MTCKYLFVVRDADGDLIDRCGNVESTVSVLYGDLSSHDGRARTVTCPEDSVGLLETYARENADCWGIPVDNIMPR